jgi:hypothetical protein
MVNGSTTGGLGPDGLYLSGTYYFSCYRAEAQGFSDSEATVGMSYASAFTTVTGASYGDPGFGSQVMDLGFWDCSFGAYIDPADVIISSC